ncbi:hypothetical protein [Pseudomonas tolaasii]|nr:hypothetical protein [Pseudomonas tolaasii]
MTVVLPVPAAWVLVLRGAPVAVVTNERSTPLVILLVALMETLPPA